MNIIPFNEKYFPQAIQLVDNHWRKEYDGQSETLKNIVFEFVVDMQIKITV